MMKWSTRLMIALAVVVAEFVALVICSLAYLMLMSIVGTTFYYVSNLAGTVVITIVAPALALWLVRRAWGDARGVSWFLVGAVAVVNLGIAWFVTAFPADFESHRGVLTFVSIGVVFLAALSGSLIRRGGMTFGSAGDQKPGVRVS